MCNIENQPRTRQSMYGNRRIRNIQKIHMQRTDSNNIITILINENNIKTSKISISIFNWYQT